MKPDPTDFTPTTLWGIERVREHDPIEADGIEAALRCMKRIQAEPEYQTKE